MTITSKIITDVKTDIFRRKQRKAGDRHVKDKSDAAITQGRVQNHHIEIRG